MAQLVSIDADGAVVGHIGRHDVVAAQTLDQVRGAAVDELFGEFIVERIGEAVFDLARLFLPAAGVAHPFAAMRQIRPGTDRCDAIHKHVDVTVDAIEPVHVSGNPVVGHHGLALGQMAVHLRHQAGVKFRFNFAEVRHLRDVPKKT